VLVQLLDRTRELEAHRGHSLSEAVFLHSREAIFVTDAEGGIERVNPAFERITGLPATAVQGRPAVFLFAQSEEGRAGALPRGRSTAWSGAGTGQAITDCP